MYLNVMVLSVSENDLEKIHDLVAVGASVNCANREGAALSIIALILTGNTPLHMAILLDDVTVPTIETLLDLGRHL